MTASNTTAQDQTDTTVSDTKSHLGIIFFALILTMLMSSLGQMIFATALPTIVGELGGVDHMSWVISAFLLAQTVAMPIVGKLGDMIGRKGLFMMGIALFMVGSVMGAITNSMSLLIAARAFQGFAGGTLMVSSQAILAEVIPARQRGKYMGIMGAVFGLSSVLGPVLGGWFTDGPGWRWGLWINVPMGVVALSAAAAFLKLPRRQSEGNFDYIGTMFLTAAASTLILTTTWGGTQYDWNSGVIISLIVASVVSWVLFFLTETRVSNPLIPTHLFNNRNFVLTTVSGLILGIAMFGTMAYIPTYLQMVHSMSPTAAGLMMTPMMVGMLLTSIGVGQIISRTGKYRFYPFVGLMIMAVSLYLLSTLETTTPLWQVGVYLFIMGFGLGTGMQVLVLIVQNSFPVAMVGTATAANNFFRQIGGAVGSSIVGSIFIHSMKDLAGERVPAAIEQIKAASPEAAAEFAKQMGPEGFSSKSIGSLTPHVLDSMPAPIHEALISSYNDGLTPIFLVLMPVIILAAIIVFFVREDPLKETVE